MERRNDRTEQIRDHMLQLCLGIARGTEPIDTSQKQRLKAMFDSIFVRVPIVRIPEITVSSLVKLPPEANDNFYMQRRR